MRPVLVIVVGYLLGSIPFGYLIVRARAGTDIRNSGSGGTGATNVSRRAGKLAGGLTLILDTLKGALGVLVAKSILSFGILPYGAHANALERNGAWWVALAAIFIIVGHIFPVWLGFRGGKGVATGLGVFLILSPLAVACAAVLFFLVVVLTRYVSLASVVAAAAIPLFVWLQNKYIQAVSDFAPVMIAAIVGAFLIIFAHRGNIGRLLDGTESKFR